jgi:hypothetical protein
VKKAILPACLLLVSAARAVETPKKSKAPIAFAVATGVASMYLYDVAKGVRSEATALHDESARLLQMGLSARSEAVYAHSSQVARRAVQLKKLAVYMAGAAFISGTLGLHLLATPDSVGLEGRVKF